MLIHNTHAALITIQETKLTPKAKTPKVHNCTTVRTDRLLITLIGDNITFTTTDIPLTINTYNTELQMVHIINNTKHITISNAHSTFWNSYTDEHRGQLTNTTQQQTSLSDIITVSNTLYNQTLLITQHALSSDHIPIITTINIRHDSSQ